MLQLSNTTPFRAGIDVFPDRRGVDTLHIAVKATFRLGASLTIAEEQAPLHPADVYWGEPGRSSVRYPGDRHLLKPSTDVLLVGQAHAPRGKPTRELLVEVEVAGLHKVVRVVGDRAWAGGGTRATAPVPFLAMPLVYERAFGGCSAPDEDPGEEPRNPVGRGFRGASDRDIDGTPLPNLEDPRSSVLDVGDRAAPACFAPIAPAWSPRRAYAGTYDEAWRSRRAPYLPADFDPRFFHTAPAELVAPGHLQGGEPVRVVNAAPDGPLHTTLPTCALAIEVQIAGVRTPLRPNLETVLIEPDDWRLCMVWRAALACDKQALLIERVAIRLDELRFQ